MVKLLKKKTTKQKTEDRQKDLERRLDIFLGRPTVKIDSSVKLEYHTKPLSLKETHWIATTQKRDKMFYFEGKLLSAENEQRVINYKKSNKIYKAWLKKQQDALDKLKNAIKPRAMYEIEQAYQKLGEQVRRAGNPFNLSGQMIQMGKVSDELYPMGLLSPTPNKAKVKQQINRLKAHLQGEDISVANHGLNSFCDRHKIKDPVDMVIKMAQMKKQGKLYEDYFTISYQDAVAIAESVGMLHQELLESVIDYIAKRAKHYKTNNNIMAGIAGETLVNLWLKAVEDKKPMKLTMTMFFNSNARKKWSKDYNYDWKNYKRFHEEFKKWIKIFTARATKKKEISDGEFETYLEFLSQTNSKGLI